MFITLPVKPGVSVLTVIPGFYINYYSSRLLHINLLILLFVHCTFLSTRTIFRMLKKQNHIFLINPPLCRLRLPPCHLVYHNWPLRYSQNTTTRLGVVCGGMLLVVAV